MKRKLSKSTVSRHENEKLPRNPVLLTKSTHSYAFSTFDYRILILEATLISSTVHVRRCQRVNHMPDNVGGWHHWVNSTLRKL